MVALVDKVLAKLGFVRAKSYDQLWAMARESALFQGSVTREYEQVPTVYKAIKAIADNVGQAELEFFSRATDEEITNEDIERLFENPNPLMSFNELLEATVVFHRLEGEAFWIFTESIGNLTGANHIPAEIWPVAPKKMKELKQNGQLIGWKYGQEVYPIERVMHFRDVNPYDDIRGLSPLKPARDTIDLDWSQMIYNKAFFKNDATPSFALTTEQALNKTQRDQLKEWWDKQHRGASNAFKTAVFESGVKPLSISHSATEMQFLDQKKMNREELIGIWRVPKSMFSITDDINYATFIGQKKVFWTDTIMPILNRLAEELNSQFFSRVMPGVYCRFDFSNVLALQEDLKERVETVSKLFAMGVPFNKLNEKFNLGIDDIDGGDVGFIPFGLTPINSVINPPEPAPVSAPPDNAPPKGLTLIQTEGLWKYFLRRHEPLEQKMAEVVRAHLYQQRTRVLSTLNEKAMGKTIQFSFDWVRESKIFAEKVSPVLLQAIAQGAEYARNVAGGTVADLILDGKLRAYLAVQVNELKRITEFQRSKVEGIISAGIQNGSSVGEIAGNLRTFYNGFTPVAAMRISRTETTRGINGGTVQFFEAVGAKTKTWITANDENVRDSHAHLHGKTIAMNARFDNGLMFPGDEGPASEVVNCRCTVITRERFNNTEE